MTALRIGMVGIGYAGLPMAVALARAGNQVFGYDIDRHRVDVVNAGRSPVDTVTGEEIAALGTDLRASADPAVLAGCEVILICAPTPVDRGEPNLRPLLGAVATVRDQLRPGQLVVVESTTHPGTTDGLVLPVLEESGLVAGVDFNLAYSPERIDPGNARFGVANTPRVVGGLTPACRDRAAAVYDQVGQVHLARGMREAEAAKILENTYRQVNIALVNEFAQICHGMGIDVWDTIEAAATKPYGFASFWPGAGVGGHCIPADPLYLVHEAASQGMAFRMAETAHEINESQPLWVADRVCKELELGGIPAAGAATVLLLGVTYKADTVDTRHTPAAPIARFLQDRGVRVLCHDPYANGLAWPGGRIERVPDLDSALAQADMTVLLQRHRQYGPEVFAAARRLFDTTGSVATPRTVRL
ncbi:nucleotide sugar dehydrogenase [Actinoplanes sp. NPDC049118]|uniref:nucleotide sugar dehydrogenase n=1 Tax=Actinoplanes sp. NPDC049118 TaxID=3155769 RepID=UPI0033FEACEA